jgi:two-component system NtrC family sensor kinase
MPEAVKSSFSKDAAFYRCLFDQSPFPSLVLSPDMLVMEVNQAFLDHFNLSRDEAVGQPCHQVFHGSEEPCTWKPCCFDDAMRGRTDCFNLHEYLDDDGNQVIEEVVLTPLKDAGGKVWGVIESVHDISEAKNLEHQLTEAKAFLTRILDSLVGVVVATDLRGNILFVNKSAETVLGYEIHELVGRRIDTISTREETLRIKRIVQEHGGRALMVSSFLFTKDGEKVPVRVNSTYVYLDGEPVATVGIHTDLRSWLRMEDEVAQARMQVVQSDKMAGLGRMAAGIAHELNNPLTGITVFTELLMETLPEDSPAHADLSGILEDAERCRDIVKGLLDYSRQSEFQAEQADLSELVEEAFNLIRDNTLFMNVKVWRNYHDEPLKVFCDKKQVRQVFINLLMNGVDAMDGKGELTVSTGRDDEGWPFAIVSDTGPGIGKENLDRVFDPFFTTKEIGKGTGLGLSVVLGVVKRHGGEISVKSTGPEGTSFLVRMPQELPEKLLALVSRTYDNKPIQSDDEEIK